MRVSVCVTAFAGARDLSLSESGAFVRLGAELVLKRRKLLREAAEVSLLRSQCSLYLFELRRQRLRSTTYPYTQAGSTYPLSLDRCLPVPKHTQITHI